MPRTTAHRFPVLPVLGLCVAVLACSPSAAGGAWLLDRAAFHLSAHGSLACLDCHGDKLRDPDHPHPGHVNRERLDFFDASLCLDCHEDIADAAADGTHGGDPAGAHPDRTLCIGCHDPHEQAPRGRFQGRFDPSLPIEQQCGACHPYQEALPEPPPGDKPCLKCHDRTGSGKALCLTCHLQGAAVVRDGEPVRVPSLDPGVLTLTGHPDLSCLGCHLRADRFPHNRQALASCADCHERHLDATANAPHLTVACEACHLQAVLPVRNPDAGTVAWRKTGFADANDRTHRLTDFTDRSSCRRCHRGGNDLGAAAMVLPAKGILCLPCHPAAFSAADPVTRIALLILAAGLGGWAWFWFSGTPSAPVPGDLPSARARIMPKPMAVALLLDVAAQRRLWRQSRFRWWMHGLMVYPMAARFLWGVSAAVLAALRPEWPLTGVLVDNNHPAAAFFFDLTGMMMLAGIIGLVVRRARAKASEPPGLPPWDRIAPVLFGGMVLSGFVVEAVRMVMTGHAAPPAFIGYLSARVLNGRTAVPWESVYGYLWYTHALFVGAFAAYLPFGRLFHMITAPVSLVLGAAREPHGAGGRKTR